MDSYRKRMQREWLLNSQKYTDSIGMTGRRPIPEEFTAIIDEIHSRFDLTSARFHRVLDVGCNNGYLLEQLNPDADMIVGVDFCNLPLTEGKKHSDDIHFIQAEAGHLPFPDNSFDRVICYSLFHYLPSTNSAISVSKELYRVLTVGGSLFIGDLFSRDHRHLIPANEVAHWDDESRPFMHRFRNWLFISIDELRELFNLSGASNVIMIPQHGTKRCPSFRYDIIVKKGPLT
ncbi:class I SAM-dependent methyltransferase [bacterium]|nr:class I SAM-dependent methyltransferase [candidate division CSSED10-310 bacterium]